MARKYGTSTELKRTLVEVGRFGARARTTRLVQTSDKQPKLDGAACWVWLRNRGRDRLSARRALGLALRLKADDTHRIAGLKALHSHAEAELWRSENEGEFRKGFSPEDLAQAIVAAKATLEADSAP